MRGFHDGDDGDSIRDGAGKGIQLFPGNDNETDSQEGWKLDADTETPRGCRQTPSGGREEERKRDGRKIKRGSAGRRHPPEKRGSRFYRLR